MDPRLFIHDVSTNKDREVSFEEAQKLNLDASLISPDGYQVIRAEREDGFFSLFFGGYRDYNRMYLEGHNTSKKLELQSSDIGRYGYASRRFIGWIQ